MHHTSYNQNVATLQSYNDDNDHDDNDNDGEDNMMILMLIRVMRMIVIIIISCREIMFMCHVQTSKWYICKE